MTVLTLLLAGAAPGADWSLSEPGLNPDGLAWPMCGRLTEQVPNVDPRLGCPTERLGTATDLPLAFTYGPRLTQAGGTRYDFHRAVDVESGCGTPVFAVSTGVVDEVRLGSPSGDPRITLEHEASDAGSTCEGGCYHTIYLHLAEVVVGAGDPVLAGDLIGYSGYSGVGELVSGLDPLYSDPTWNPAPVPVPGNACELRPPGAFRHLHFEVREAPVGDDESNWLHDAVHPMAVLPYVNDPVDNGILLAVTELDATVPSSPVVTVQAQMSAGSALDFDRVEVEVHTATGASIPQPGAAPTPVPHALHAFFLDPPWVALQELNLMYTHKDSGSFPWDCPPGGGCFDDVCPHAAAHGGAYAADEHLVDPAEVLFRDFNGVVIAPAPFHDEAPPPCTPRWAGLGCPLPPVPVPWEVRFTFTALAGPAGGAVCVRATAADVHGVESRSSWVCQ